MNAVLGELWSAIDGLSPSLIYKQDHTDYIPSARHLAYDLYLAVKVAHRLAHLGMLLPPGLHNITNRFAITRLVGIKPVRLDEKKWPLLLGVNFARGDVQIDALKEAFYQLCVEEG